MRYPLCLALLLCVLLTSPLAYGLCRAYQLVRPGLRSVRVWVLLSTVALVVARCYYLGLMWLAESLESRAQRSVMRELAAISFGAGYWLRLFMGLGLLLTLGVLAWSVGLGLLRVARQSCPWSRQ